jgi:micrococcal nuclease
MIRRCILVGISVLVLLEGCRWWPGSIDEPCHDPTKVVVSRVIDGDTIEVTPPVRIGEVDQDTFRLLCINTPETRNPPECYGNEAKEHARTVLGGQEVELVFDSECTDSYDRGLAYVKLGSRLYNYDVVRDGYAVLIDPFFATYTWCPDIQEVMIEARDGKVGGWEKCADEPPWSEVELIKADTSTTTGD